ncbi:MAG: ABC transporter ATP-binding protein [Lachnospiraceae bacterium]|nr:ABC transporter ATP-binding protein [Lachnospiraceae bacterium]
MIKVTNASKHFGDFAALSNMNTEIPEGCIYGLIGSNGAGKSTFLRMVTGIYQSEGGEILIDGEPVWNNPDVKQKMVFVPDDLYFLPGSNMYRMRDMYKRYYPSFDEQCFRELTEKFQLNPKAPISTFSKGMKRQASTILALSCHPQYLFFDETFDGLDPVIRNQVKQEIIKDAKERKTTIVITSHSLKELEDVCDQLTLLHKGGIIFGSDVANLKTSMFKVQVAFAGEFDESLFNGIEIVNFSKKGHVANIIIRGEKEDVIPMINDHNPLLLDIFPLSLEEVFVYEMEALGYAFGNVLDQEDGK